MASFLPVDTSTMAQHWFRQGKCIRLEQEDRKKPTNESTRITIGRLYLSQTIHDSMAMNPQPRRLSTGSISPKEMHGSFPKPKRLLLYGIYLVFSAEALLTSPMLAQDASIPFSRLRATNIARMRAETINGGLSEYRSASCMFEQGGGICLLLANEQGYFYRFLGGPPGWQQTGKEPTVETEIHVSPDGRQVLQIIYNGPVR